MTKLRRRLAEAVAALAALDESAQTAAVSVVERDAAILRLMYSFEAIWRAAQRLLAERDNIEVGSPNDAIRAARRLGWMSDEDAEAAMRIGADCNIAAHSYQNQIGVEIGKRLPAHAAVLRRWLTVLQTKFLDIKGSQPSRTYLLFEQAMLDKKQVVCTYEGHTRELCPIILGHSRGEERALTYQFAGGARGGLPAGGQWKCLWLFKASGIRLRDGPWRSGTSHAQKQTCVEVVDLDVNPDSPYRPQRQLATKSLDGTSPQGGRQRTVRRSDT